MQDNSLIIELIFVVDECDILSFYPNTRAQLTGLPARTLQASCWRTWYWPSTRTCLAPPPPLPAVCPLRTPTCGRGCPLSTPCRGFAGFVCLPAVCALPMRQLSPAVGSLRCQTDEIGPRPTNLPVHVMCRRSRTPMHFTCGTQCLSEMAMTRRIAPGISHNRGLSQGRGGGG